ncbi:hypothetical protein CGJ25_03180 [Vibrio parahaemolyticus]|nr:hypothetical protein [Vibrio parahaemolyticus]EGQ8797299.1 hypothetical protein [Vibrio parahaemolyticus]EGQ8840173.1 hypothetical protein [Vibrio parahaemolyticus]EGQ8952807.1 hypothetical protein [Vibrio parahaemolyticus]EGQ8987200.1 hypothetical protein [Vibrio parahaemolyticus]
MNESVDAATAVIIGETKRFIIFSLFIESAEIKAAVYDAFVAVTKGSRHCHLGLLTNSVADIAV